MLAHADNHNLKCVFKLFLYKMPTILLHTHTRTHTTLTVHLHFSNMQSDGRTKNTREARVLSVTVLNMKHSHECVKNPLKDSLFAVEVVAV